MRVWRENKYSGPARTIVDSIIQALRPFVGECGLSVNRAAEICRMKPRAMSRLLATHGTNLTKIINDMKRDVALEELENSDRSVLDIATSLGYGDPTSFARSFKKWTGASPREFRVAKKTDVSPAASRDDERKTP